ncbi:MAG: hypothetical protein QM526_00195 [Alphaproteobacteria bacterium]|nr:hypothetical protein [Alphaproteobacteria bacterium]
MISVRALLLGGLSVAAVLGIYFALNQDSAQNPTTTVRPPTEEPDVFGGVIEVPGEDQAFFDKLFRRPSTPLPPKNENVFVPPTNIQSETFIPDIVPGTPYTRSELLNLGIDPLLYLQITNNPFIPTYTPYIAPTNSNTSTITTTTTQLLANNSEVDAAIGTDVVNDAIFKENIELIAPAKKTTLGDAVKQFGISLATSIALCKSLEAIFPEGVAVNEGGTAKDCGLDSLAESLEYSFIKKLANQYAQWASTGFQGKPLDLDNPIAFWNDVTEYVTSEYNAGWDPNNLACSFGPDIQAKLRIALSTGDTSLQKKGCSTSDIIKNTLRVVNETAKGLASAAITPVESKTIALEQARYERAKAQARLEDQRRYTEANGKLAALSGCNSSDINYSIFTNKISALINTSMLPSKVFEEVNTILGDAGAQKLGGINNYVDARYEASYQLNKKLNFEADVNFGELVLGNTKEGFSGSENASILEDPILSEQRARIIAAATTLLESKIKQKFPDLKDCKKVDSAEENKEKEDNKTDLEKAKLKKEARLEGIAKLVIDASIKGLIKGGVNASPGLSTKTTAELERFCLQAKKTVIVGKPGSTDDCFDGRENLTPPVRVSVTCFENRTVIKDEILFDGSYYKVVVGGKCSPKGGDVIVVQEIEESSQKSTPVDSVDKENIIKPPTEEGAAPSTATGALTDTEKKIWMYNYALVLYRQPNSNNDASIKINRETIKNVGYEDLKKIVDAKLIFNTAEEYTNACKQLINNDRGKDWILGAGGNDIDVFKNNKLRGSGVSSTKGICYIQSNPNKQKSLDSYIQETLTALGIEQK